VAHAVLTRVAMNDPHLKTGWTSWATRVGPLLSAAFVALAVLLGGRDAAATIAVTDVKITVPAGGAARLPRPAAAQYWISYQDCLDDTQFQFTVTSDVAFFDGASVSYPCGTPYPTPEPALASERCYSDNKSYPAGTNLITLGARSLVQGTLGIPVTGADSCQASAAPAGSNLTWPMIITLYFFAPPVAGVASTDATTWPAVNPDGTSGSPGIEIALVGPLPPSPISLSDGIGDLMLDLPKSASVGTVGYYVFCYPSGGTGTGGGAADGGTGACPSSAAIPDIDLLRPDPSSPYVCGAQVPASSGIYPISRADAKGDPLVDGPTYVVGVAGYDAANNLGPMSVYECIAPEPTLAKIPHPDDSGGCAMSAPTAGACWPALGAAALAGFLALKRRQRR
jgi:hypothetical protein